jgi:hypothetical protein
MINNEITSWTPHYRSELNIHEYNAYPYLNNNKVWPVSYGILNPMVNWPRGQFTMGFKIPYDTGVKILGIKISG